MRNRRHLIKSEDVVVEDRPELQDVPDQQVPVRVSQETAPAEERVQPHLDPPQTNGDTPERRAPTPVPRRRSSRSTQGQRPDYLGNFVYY